MTERLPVLHTPPPTKIIVLISGSGTNLQALLDASTTSLLPSTIIIRVISNRKDVQGLKRAEKALIPTSYHNLISGQYHKKGEKDPAVLQKAREAYDTDLADLVLKDSPDLVVCAGWMHILAPSFLEPLEIARVPIINLHPALPGAYDGAGAIRRAYDDFQREEMEGVSLEERKHTHTGVMVHYVISKVDRGEPILVREVQFKRGESLDELESRMHEVEHKIIVIGTGLAIARLWEERRNARGSI